MENTLVKYINEQPYEIRQLIADFHRVKWVEEYVKRRSILRKRVILASFSQYDCCHHEWGVYNLKMLPLIKYVKDVYDESIEKEDLRNRCIDAYVDMARYYDEVGDRKGMGRLARIHYIAEKFFSSVRDEYFRGNVANWELMPKPVRSLHAKNNVDKIDIKLFHKTLENHFLNFNPNKHGY